MYTMALCHDIQMFYVFRYVYISLKSHAINLFLWKTNFTMTKISDSLSKMLEKVDFVVVKNCANPEGILGHSTHILQKM